jgi:hypothetical protein
VVAHLARERGHGPVVERAVACERRAAGVEDGRAATDELGERSRHTAEAELGEHHPLEPLVRGDGALEQRVVLVDQVRRRLLGHGDEGDVVRHLYQREAELLGGVGQRRRYLRVPEAGPEAHPGQAGPRQPSDERSLRLGVAQLQPGGEEQLPARQPGRGVDQL